MGQNSKSVEQRIRRAASVGSKFNGWNESDSWSLNAVTGIYDDPENQAQLPLSVDFANGGHLAVCGSVVTGKSTFLQTLIYSLAVKYSPNVVNFYILDFSSGMLSSFEKLPHTPGSPTCRGLFFSLRQRT